MSRKFEIWLDSGANIHSCYKQILSLDELGLDDETWDGMTDEEKDDFMREEAFSLSDWGYREIGG